MLPLVYSDAEIAAKIVEDPESAPIPALHRAMYRWVRKFVRESWNMDESDIAALRAAGVSDHEIVLWAQLAGMQTYLVMMGDGGGVELDYDRTVGAVVGRDRPSYTGTPGDLLAAAPGAGECTGHASATGEGAWVAPGASSPEYEQAAAWAQARYGFVPRLLSSARAEARCLRTNVSALELLEGPQSQSLGRRRHALVRALVSHLNRAPYSTGTTRALLSEFDRGDALYEALTADWDPARWNEQDRVVLEFAIKATRNAYKIVARDAAGFREVGLDDEAYVDVLNTVALQTSFDRLTNSLGIAADAAPVIPRARSAA